MGYKLTLTALAAAVIAHQAVAAPSTEEMWEIIQQQQAEIQRLKQQVKQTDQKVEMTADAVEKTSSSSASASGWAAKTKIGGYGEHHFNHIDNKDDKVDAHRFVAYISHQYTDKVKFFSEIELEHSLAGDGKPGEVELEQAYIQYDYAQNHNLIAGQFLIPVGFLNETHEPETFYGTERNPVEKNIIPATWWETGAMLTGEIAPGFSYNAGLHSGLKADDGGKIRSGRQKSAKATAEDLAFTGRLKYTGIKGLELAATLQQQQDITQGNGIGSGEATLIALNAAYQYDGLSLRALWSSWDIDGDTFEANGRDEQTGWYIEAGYRFANNLGIFVRQNEWDNEAGNSDDTEYAQTDFGLNYWLVDNVVFKLDYSDIDAPEGKEDYDALNLGVGWSF